MGINNLTKFIKDNADISIKKIEINTLKNKKIAIDTSIILYKYITAIRNNGKDLQTSKGCNS